MTSVLIWNGVPPPAVVGLGVGVWLAVTSGVAAGCAGVGEAMMVILPQLLPPIRTTVADTHPTNPLILTSYQELSGLLPVTGTMALGASWVTMEKLVLGPLRTLIGDAPSGATEQGPLEGIGTATKLGCVGSGVSVGSATSGVATGPLAGQRMVPLLVSRHTAN